MNVVYKSERRYSFTIDELRRLGLAPEHDGSHPDFTLTEAKVFDNRGVPTLALTYERFESKAHTSVDVLLERAANRGAS